MGQQKRNRFVISTNLWVGLHEKQRSVKPETFNTHCIVPHFLFCFMKTSICMKTKNIFIRLMILSTLIIFSGMILLLLINMENIEYIYRFTKQIIQSFFLFFPWEQYNTFYVLYEIWTKILTSIHDIIFFCIITRLSLAFVKIMVC